MGWGIWKRMGDINKENGEGGRRKEGRRKGGREGVAVKPDHWRKEERE